MAVIHAILFSAAWIASCAVALTVESCLVLQTSFPPPRLLVFVFAATFCHYNLHYLVRTRDVSRSARDRWMTLNRKSLIVLTALMSVVAAWMLPGFNSTERFIIAGAAAVSGIYSLPILPRGWRLRDLGVVKPFALALVWAIVTVWLPASDADAYVLSLVVLRRFVFMAALCLAFDIRDVEKDRTQGVHTVPVQWGTWLTYRLIDGLLLVFVALALLVEVDKRRPAVGLVLTASAAATALVIRSTRRWPSEEYYLGVVDGMMLLQAVLVVVAVDS
jgi:4-hydroxybenzoate polyprenyltransferase